MRIKISSYYGLSKELEDALSGLGDASPNPPSLRVFFGRDIVNMRQDSERPATSSLNNTVTKTICKAEWVHQPDLVRVSLETVSRFLTAKPIISATSMLFE